MQTKNDDSTKKRKCSVLLPDSAAKALMEL